MATPPKRPSCTATTRAGNPCRNPRLDGQQTCRIHTPGRSRRPQPTDELIATIVATLETGVTLRDAALVSGISERTFHAWMERGEADLTTDAEPTPFARFAQSVTRARATARVRATAALHRAAVGFEYETLNSEGNLVTVGVPADWKAAAHFLERSDPERWARREKVEHSGLKGAEPFVVSPEGERREEVLATLRAVLPPQD